jgi:uncharacterized protein YbbC (DUF1343 family)
MNFFNKMIPVKHSIITLCLLIAFSVCMAQNKPVSTDESRIALVAPEASDKELAILPGAERIDVYLPLIKGKRVGIFANQTSMAGKTHLVDTLRKLGINIKVIFGPEHGFRGTADAGEKVGNYMDEKTGIPVISLYGSKKAPSAEDLKDIDILIFDLQDVGVRFYTYITSLQNFMEAAFENSKPLLLLDRPNPNGFYVDGPVLDMKFKSGVGSQPIPIVYGMTIAEYAFMIAGEKWLSEKANAKYDYYRTAQNSPDTPFHFQVIKCRNYTHKSKYILPVKPSPNLPNIQSIYLYPSTCLFEGTVLSEGRGTNKQFQVFGHPLFPKDLYSFTPNPNEGAKSSKLYGQLCYGWDLSGTAEEVLALFPQKDSFFLKTNSFNRLAGNDVLMQQIKDGKSEEEIRKSWEPKLSEFKAIRKKYLLYDDFE